MRNYILLFIILFFFSLNQHIYAQQAENTYKYMLGEIEFVLLSEGQQQGSDGILIGATQEMKDKTLRNGTFPNATNAFLIKTPEKNILIDTGFGRNLFDNMEKSGITSDQINVILLTHMHGDHIGGMLKENRLSFPNAEVYIPQPEYDYWMNDEIMNQHPENRRGSFLNARKVIKAYQDRLHLFQPGKFTDKNDLIPGVKSVAGYGHTPGHTLYLIESENEKLLVWGDLTHAMAIQMSYPQVAVTYDTHPEDAIRSRQEVLEYVSVHQIPIAGMHIAYPAMGDIKTGLTGNYLFIPFVQQ